MFTSIRTGALAMALSTSSLLLACGAPSGDAAEEANSAVVAESTVPQVSQTLFYLPDARLQASIDAFRARNEAGWEPKSPAPRFNTNPLTGSVSEMVRRGPYAADVSLTAERAIAIAKSFFLRNADLLGVTPAELDATTPSTFAIGFGDYRFIVNFRAKLPVPGYEAFVDDIPKSIDLQVSIARDGSPRNISCHVTGFPGLSITTTPALKPNDPLIAGHVLGRKLEWTEDTGTFTDPVVTTTQLGSITPDDIVARELTIYVDPTVDGQQFTLAYRLDVIRGGHTFWFWVDTTTGALLTQGGI